MGLHVGGFIVWRGVLVAREPASRSVDKTSLSASRNADRLRNGLLRSVGARCLRVACPGPAAAHGCRSLAQVLWLAYGSARQAARSSETAIAFAGAGPASTETVVAFVGANGRFGAFFGCSGVAGFNGRCLGRAVVPAVSCWPAPVAAEVLLVSTAPRCRASCAKKFALLGLMVGEREKVRPAHEKWPQIGVFWRAGRVFSRKCRWRGVLGEFFAEMPTVGIPG